MLFCSAYSGPCTTRPCREYFSRHEETKDVLTEINRDYAVKVFGLATFGTIYGTIICISGVTTFTQSAMQALTHEAFNDNPAPVNLVLAGLGLMVGTALVTYVAVAGKHVQHEVLEEEERRSQMPQDPTPRATPRLGPFLSPSLGPSYGTMRSARGQSLQRPSLANLRMLSAVDEETFHQNGTRNNSVDQNFNLP